MLVVSFPVGTRHCRVPTVHKPGIRCKILRSCRSILWSSIAYLGYCWRYPRHILTRKIAGMRDRIYECNQETRYRRFNPECFLHNCAICSIAHESRARSAQLVSPPPTVLVASEIQQEGCFPLSSEQLTDERSNPLSIACDFSKKLAASHSRAPALLCLLLMFIRSMRACGSN